MAFAVKYRMDWKGSLGIADYRVDIETDLYVGSIISLGHSLDGFELTYNEKPWVQGFEGLFSFHLNKSLADAFDADFYNSQYKKFKVKFYINFVLKNVGWLKPENSTREILGPELHYRVSFTDAIIDLENIPYDGYEGKGFQPILQIIKNALEFGGIDDLGFLLQCNLYEQEIMDPTESLFRRLYVNNDAFYEKQEGKTKPDSCYTVLEKCIKPFYCRLAQVSGAWQIINGQEYNSTSDTYSYIAMATILENVAYNRLVDINAFQVAGSKLELTKIAPVQTLITTWLNKKLGTNELVNGNFSLGIEVGWVNGPGTEFWGVFQESGGKLNLVENSGTGTPQLPKSFSSDPFSIADVGEGKGYFMGYLELNLKTFSFTDGLGGPSPGLLPFFNIRLTYPPGSGPPVETGERQMPMGVSTYPFGGESWPVDVIGDYILTVIVIPPQEYQAIVTVIDLEVDNIVLTQNAVEKGETTDIEYWSSSEVGAPGYLTLEEDIYFADGVQLSDSGVIVDSTLGIFSLKWTRHNRTLESKRLVDQFSRQFLNDRRSYFDKISVDGLIDSGEVINFNTILQLFGNTYRFTDFSKNFKTQQISGTIQQVDNYNIPQEEPPVIQTPKPRFTQWGSIIKPIFPPGHWMNSGAASGLTLGDILRSPFLNFRGNLGIGVGRNPTGRLHLPAGTELPGSAPLKITKATESGRTKMATPEDGAVEYYQENGRDYVTMTVGSTRYELTNRIFLDTIDTSGSVITFDMGFQTQKYAKASHNIQVNNTWVFVNDINLVIFKFKFTATAFVDYQFPGSVVMSDSRLDEATNKWRPNDLGVYEVEFFSENAGEHLVKIFGPFKKNNKAPQIFNNIISYNAGQNLLSGPRLYSDFEGDLENNSPPQAINFSISGIAELGSTLTLTYTFKSPSGYPEGAISIQWYRAEDDGTNEVLIGGATVATYLIGQSDVGKLIYCKFTVSQTSASPANGNPVSELYKSNVKLVVETIESVFVQTIPFSATFDAVLVGGTDPNVAWEDDFNIESGASVPGNWNDAGISPSLINLGTGSDWITVEATKPTFSTNKLVFTDDRVEGPTGEPWPPLFETWIKAKFTGGAGHLFDVGNKALLANTSSNQYWSTGLANQAGDLNEHVFRLVHNGADSKFQVDGGTVITFDESTTLSTKFILGQTQSGGSGSYGKFELKRFQRTTQGAFLTTQQVADKWAFHGF